MSMISRFAYSAARSTIPWKSKLIRNLQHMKAEHSFFIPDIGNCIDVVGLLKKLANKIAKDLTCIYCEHTKSKTFKSFRDVQKHMKDLGHCMINPDFLSEYREFYD